MIVTNRANLPDLWVDAVSIDDYNKGEAQFSPTELIRPVRIRSLLKAHFAEVEEDVSDMLWRLSGQAKHVVLERIARANPQRYIVEKRFYANMPQTGIKVGGQIDVFDLSTNILWDWKETSVWKFILGDMDEWTEQANINLFLLRMNGFHPVALKNIAMLKDWKARLARTTRKKDYPKCAINVCELEMWTIAEAQDFIAKKIQAHIEGEKDPPLCTKKERWQRDASWALMKKGRKSALRLFDNYDQATAGMEVMVRRAAAGEKFYLEERPAEPVRCLDFCPVQRFCSFGIEAEKKWRDKNGTDNKPDSKLQDT